jgi:hypothetical protein
MKKMSYKYFFEELFCNQIDIYPLQWIQVIIKQSHL